MSTIAVKKVKLGDSGSPANNFLIEVPAVADGTLTIKRENGAAVLSIDANGRLLTGGRVVLDVAFGVRSVPTGLNQTYKYASPAAVVEDTLGAFNPTTGRYTPTVAGYYAVTGVADYRHTGLGGLNPSSVNAYVYRNEDYTVYSAQAALNGGYPAISASGVYYLNGITDYLLLGTAHNGSGTANNVGGRLFAYLLDKA